VVLFVFSPLKLSTEHSGRQFCTSHFQRSSLGFERAEPFCLEEDFGLVFAGAVLREPLSRIHGFGNAGRVLSSKKKFAQLAVV